MCVCVCDLTTKKKKKEEEEEEEEEERRRRRRRGGVLCSFFERLKRKKQKAYPGDGCCFVSAFPVPIVNFRSLVFASLRLVLSDALRVFCVSVDLCFFFFCLFGLFWHFRVSSDIPIHPTLTIRPQIDRLIGYFSPKEEKGGIRRRTEKIRRKEDEEIGGGEEVRESEGRRRKLSEGRCIRRRKQKEEETKIMVRR